MEMFIYHEDKYRNEIQCKRDKQNNIRIIKTSWCEWTVCIRLSQIRIRD